MAKREVIIVPNVNPGRRSDTGRNPVPDGAKIGNLVCSGLIPGRVGDQSSDDPDKQAEIVFDNIRAFMETAGGTTEDIIQLTVYLKEEVYRSSINKAWLKMFPDPNNRPARTVLYREFGVGGTGQFSHPTYFELSLMAVIP